MIMLDPHRSFAAGAHPGEPRTESRAELRLDAVDDVAADERLLRALRTRVRGLGIERAPASLRARVRAMLDLRA